MGPKAKTASRTGRPRKAVNDTQKVTFAVGTIDPAAKPERTDSQKGSFNPALCSSSESSVPTSSVLPATKDPKPILRAARRLSHNAMRRLSGRRSGSIGDGAPSTQNRVSNGVDCYYAYRGIYRRPSRKSFANHRNIRFRESAIDILEITCLPDKPPGVIRMPHSPPLVASPSSLIEGLTGKKLPKKKGKKTSTMEPLIEESDKPTKKKGKTPGANEPLIGDGGQVTKKLLMEGGDQPTKKIVKTASTTERLIEGGIKSTKDKAKTASTMERLIRNGDQPMKKTVKTAITMEPVIEEDDQPTKKQGKTPSANEPLIGDGDQTTKKKGKIASGMVPVIAVGIKSMENAMEPLIEDSEQSTRTYNLRSRNVQICPTAPKPRRKARQK